jgi:hypothetical protein
MNAVVQSGRNQSQIVIGFVFFEQSDGAVDRLSSNLVFMDGFHKLIVEV